MLPLGQTGTHVHPQATTPERIADTLLAVSQAHFHPRSASTDEVRLHGIRTLAFFVGRFYKSPHPSAPTFADYGLAPDTMALALPARHIFGSVAQTLPPFERAVSALLRQPSWAGRTFAEFCQAVMPSYLTRAIDVLQHRLMLEEGVALLHPDDQADEAWRALRQTRRAQRDAVGQARERIAQLMPRTSIGGIDTAEPARSPGQWADYILHGPTGAISANSQRRRIRLAEQLLSLTNHEPTRFQLRDAAAAARIAGPMPLSADDFRSIMEHCNHPLSHVDQKAQLHYRMATALNNVMNRPHDFVSVSAMEEDSELSDAESHIANHDAQYVGELHEQIVQLCDDDHLSTIVSKEEEQYRKAYALSSDPAFRRRVGTLAVVRRHLPFHELAALAAYPLPDPPSGELTNDLAEHPNIGSNGLLQAHYFQATIANANGKASHATVRANEKLADLVPNEREAYLRRALNEESEVSNGSVTVPVRILDQLISHGVPDAAALRRRLLFIADATDDAVYNRSLPEISMPLARAHIRLGSRKNAARFARLLDAAELCDDNGIDEAAAPPSGPSDAPQTQTMLRGQLLSASRDIQLYGGHQSKERYRWQ